MNLLRPFRRRWFHLDPEIRSIRRLSHRPRYFRKLSKLMRPILSLKRNGKIVCGSQVDCNELTISIVLTTPECAKTIGKPNELTMSPMVINMDKSTYEGPNRALCIDRLIISVGITEKM